MKNVFKTIITSILMVTLLMSIVPTGEKAEAKSKYQKLENAVLDIKKGTDTKYTTCVKGLDKFYVQPMSKFNIKIKNLPKGAKTEFRWQTDESGFTTSVCMLHYGSSGDPERYRTYVGMSDLMPQGWIKYKKNSNKSYTVYVKDVIGNVDDYYKNHIYWNMAYWKKAVAAIARYPYEIVVTLKDGTQNVYSGVIYVNPVEAQTGYHMDRPLGVDDWWGGKKAKYHEYEDLFTFNRDENDEIYCLSK
ncbi:MAG: hypothetical protein IK138_06115 [Lachnospiraceae bacterium]|nr:hypothetical protein [Lachnospiraceae bacterium]